MTGREDDEPTALDERNRSRYDHLFALVPTAFVLAVLASVVGSISFKSALVAASVVGALAMADGLFRNPPRTGLQTG